ncbi:Salicylate carboxymethyltransferase, partial [Bienertia sinuspersici]
VPEGIENNKENINLGRTSPTNVQKAYYEQYEKDFSTFLRCRSKEVVAGGMMILTMVGRKNIELYSKESYGWFEFLAIALKDMVSEGLIEEEKLNTFNFPFYPPSAMELGFWVEKEGSFALKEVHESEVMWETTIQEENSCKSFDHNDFAKCVRAVLEPFVVNHFGEGIIDEVFNRYTEIAKVSMAKEKKNVFIN